MGHERWLPVHLTEKALKLTISWGWPHGGLGLARVWATRPDALGLEVD